MLEGLAVEVPLHLEVGVILRLDVALQVQGLSLSERELGLERHHEGGLGELRLGAGVLPLVLGRIGILRLLHLLQTSLALRVLGVQVDAALACKTQCNLQICFLIYGINIM